MVAPVYPIHLTKMTMQQVLVIRTIHKNSITASVQMKIYYIKNSNNFVLYTV